MERMEYDPAAPREWVGLGDQQELNPGRQIAADTEFDKAVTYAVKAKSHLWTVTVVHMANDTMLAAFTSDDPTDMPILDAESLAMRPMVGCFLCGELYSKRESFRKCRGELPDE